MQPLGLRRGLHQPLSCRSASLCPTRPLHPRLARHGGALCARAAAGSADAAGPSPSSSGDAAAEPQPMAQVSATTSSDPPRAQQQQVLPTTPAPSAAGAGTIDAATADASVSRAAPLQEPVHAAAAGSAASSPSTSGLPVDSPALAATTPSTSSSTPGPSPGVASAPSSPQAGPDSGGSGSPGTALSPGGPPPFLQQLLTWLASVWSALQQFPAWVQLQHLNKLREACEEEPWDADKHATYLAELGRSNPREVVARVEGRRAAVNAAVVAEYLKALIATGKVAELVKADGAANAAAAAAVAAAAADAASPRTLSELLLHLQEQLAHAHTPVGLPRDAAAPAASQAAAGGSAALGAAPLDTATAAGVASGAAVGSLAGAVGATPAGGEVPGSSLRRPLHVVLTGVPPGMLQASSGTATTSGTSISAHHTSTAATTPLWMRPLAMLWHLARTGLMLLVLAFVYLAGSQAIRRVQASGGALLSPFGANTGPPVTAAGAASGAAASASPGGGPAVEPKEYKKEELPEKSLRTFKDVKGCDEAKEELREVVEFLKNPTKFTRLGAKLPKGVLLTGPPGTGKTLLARAVAGEAGVPFFYRAGSEFEELYVGVGSRRMRALFAAAKKRSPCIVFIDEVDAIGGNRKAWENHTRKTLNQLLVEMDGFESTEGIIVMAATNLPESLDPALKRPGRFDRQVAVPLPDIKGRRDILEYYLSDKPLGTDVDRELLARQTQGFSGADLSNLINEGAILAAKEGAEAISQRMLDWAYDKILMGVERKSVKRTLEARRRTSFHEAGHALVALCTPGASPIHKATIVPRGHALGMVTQVGREDEFSINRQQMLARIRVCMGGTVAEELVFGSDQVSSGATDDLRQATSMARHMVAECGMSANIGPVYVAAHDERHGGAGVSEATRRRVDDEVSVMLGEAKEAVRVLLEKRMQDLRTLAEALLDRETLTAEEINTLLQMDKQPAPPTAAPPAGGNGGGGGNGGSTDPKPEDEVAPAPAPVQAAAEAASAATTTVSALTVSYGHVSRASADADGATCSSTGSTGGGATTSQVGSTLGGLGLHAPAQEAAAAAALRRASSLVGAPERGYPESPVTGADRGLALERVSDPEPSGSWQGVGAWEVAEASGREWNGGHSGAVAAMGGHVDLGLHEGVEVGRLMRLKMASPGSEDLLGEEADLGQAEDVARTAMGQKGPSSGNQLGAGP